MSPEFLAPETACAGLLQEEVTKEHRSWPRRGRLTRFDFRDNPNRDEHEPYPASTSSITRDTIPSRSSTNDLCIRCGRESLFLRARSARISRAGSSGIGDRRPGRQAMKNVKVLLKSRAPSSRISARSQFLHHRSRLSRAGLQDRGKWLRASILARPVSSSKGWRVRSGDEIDVEAVIPEERAGKKPSHQGAKRVAGPREMKAKK